MKLILLPKGDWSPFAAARFFKQNFPCSRFIINIRSNSDEQLESRSESFLWSDDVDWENMKKELDRQNKFLFRFQELMGNETATLIDMDDWKNDVGILDDVVRWLGYKQCHFNALLHENHDRFDLDKTTKIDLGRKCH